MMKILKQYKIAIVVALLITIIGTTIVVLCSNNTKVKDFSNEYYSFTYDNTWSIKSTSEDKLHLKHKSGSTVKAEIVQLTDEYKYASIDDILDEFLYSIEKQNDSFHLISKEEQNITKFEYEGFKLLYENGEEQVLIYVFKRSDKIIIISFEADNAHFDILLDSVQNIVYNFNISDEKYEIPDSLKVETSKIDFAMNDKLTNLDTDTLTIADKNYYVEYSVPKGFEASDYSSDGGMYYYTVEEGNKISLFSSIFNSNIYKYIDKDKTFGTLYTEVSDSIKTGEDKDYTDFKEDIEEISGDFPGYIYRATYTYKGGYFDDSKKEKIIMVFAIDKNHTLKLDIESSDIPITKEFIEKIQILSAKNYSSFVQREVVDGNIITQLKQYTDYNKDKTMEVTLKVPKEYTEQDKGYNIYEYRFFNKEYDENTEVWNYEVNYKLSAKSTSVESQLSLLSLKYEKDYSDYVYKSDITLNGKTFKLYEGSYTDLTNTLFDRVRFKVDAKALLYELDNGGYVVIEVLGNDVEVSNDILNEVTNFDIEQKI